MLIYLVYFIVFVSSPVRRHVAGNKPVFGIPEVEMSSLICLTVPREQFFTTRNTLGQGKLLTIYACITSHSKKLANVGPCHGRASMRGPPAPNIQLPRISTLVSLTPSTNAYHNSSHTAETNQGEPTQVFEIIGEGPASPMIEGIRNVHLSRPV